MIQVTCNSQNHFKWGKVTRHLSYKAGDFLFRSNFVAYVRDVIVCRVTKPACTCNTRDSKHGFQIISWKILLLATITCDESEPKLLYVCLRNSVLQCIYLRIMFTQPEGLGIFTKFNT